MQEGPTVKRDRDDNDEIIQISKRLKISLRNATLSELKQKIVHGHYEGQTPISACAYEVVCAKPAGFDHIITRLGDQLTLEDLLSFVDGGPFQGRQFLWLIAALASHCTQGWTTKIIERLGEQIPLTALRYSASGVGVESTFTTLWLFGALAQLGHPQSFDKVVLLYGPQLTQTDLRFQPSAGLGKGQTLLWLSSIAASIGHTYSIQVFWDCLGPSITLDDLRTCPENGVDKDKTALWLLVLAGCNHKLPIAKEILKKFGPMLTIQDLRVCPNGGDEEGESLLCLIAKLSLMDSEILKYLPKSLLEQITMEDLRQKSLQGKTKGLCALWYLGAFDIIQRWEDQLTLEDLRICAINNIGQPITLPLLWRLVFKTAKNPSYWVNILKMCRPGLTLVDLRIKNSNKGPHEGTTILWYMVKAAAEGHPSALEKTLENPSNILTLQDLRTAAKMSGESVLFLLLVALHKRSITKETFMKVGLSVYKELQAEDLNFFTKSNMTVIRLLVDAVRVELLDQSVVENLFAQIPHLCNIEQLNTNDFENYLTNCGLWGLQIVALIKQQANFYQAMQLFQQSRSSDHLRQLETAAAQSVAAGYIYAYFELAQCYFSLNLVDIFGCEAYLQVSKDSWHYETAILLAARGYFTEALKHDPTILRRRVLFTQSLEQALRLPNLSRQLIQEIAIAYISEEKRENLDVNMVSEHLQQIGAGTSVAACFQIFDELKLKFLQEQLATLERLEQSLIPRSVIPNTQGIEATAPPLVFSMVNTQNTPRNNSDDRLALTPPPRSLWPNCQIS